MNLIVEFAGCWRPRTLTNLVAILLAANVGVSLAGQPAAEAPAKKGDPPPAAAKPPDQLTDDAEWVVELGTKKEEDAKLKKYKDLLFKGTISGDEDRRTITEVIRFKLAQLTLKRNREAPPPKKDGEDAKAAKPHRSLQDIRQEIHNDVKLARKPQGGGKDVLPVILNAILAECPTLLEYHFAARLNCAILLAEITVSESPDTPFVAAHPLMIKIARDSSQLDAVRIWGVLGCRRLLTYDQTSAEVRALLVKSLVEQLKEQRQTTKEDKARHDWLNFRTVETLGHCNTIMVDRKPEVVEVLAQVIIDPNHPWRPRYYAAQAIGRLPMDGNINLSMISVEIVRLGQQVALEYNKSRDDPTWKIAAWRIYFAFKPETDVDKTRQSGLKNQVDSKPGLGAAKKPVTDAYEAMLPVINGMLQGQKLPDESLDKLNKWLLANTPKDYKVYPNADPLTPPEDKVAAVGQ